VHIQHCRRAQQRNRNGSQTWACQARHGIAKTTVQRAVEEFRRERGWSKGKVDLQEEHGTDCRVSHRATTTALLKTGRLHKSVACSGYDKEQHGIKEHTSTESVRARILVSHFRVPKIHVA